MLRTIFHLLVVMINTSCIVYDHLYIDIPIYNKIMEDLPLKSRCMFLTYWCGILQTVYHFVSLLNDVLGSNEAAPKRPLIIRRIRDNLFTLAFCIGVFVSILFWVIYLNVDSKMMEPLDMDKLYHPFMNHVMHTTCSVFIIIELFVSNITFPSRKIGFTILYSFLVAYMVWFFTVYIKSGAWVYPFCEHVSVETNVVVIAISLAFNGILYLLGEKLNNIIRGNSKSNDSKSNAKVGKKKTK